jgi:perosamine synthetase
MSDLILPSLYLPDIRISWFVYVVRLAASFTPQQRDALQLFLQREGIGCARYFAPIHLQPSYTEWKDANLPVTEDQATRTLALPFFNGLSQLQIKEVAAALRRGLSSLI